MTNIVILISGRGSNMQAIVKACKQGRLNASVVAVISNRPDAAGLDFATEHGIATHVVDHKSVPNRKAFDQRLHALLEQLQPDWIALAGFMRVLGHDVVNAWLGRMVNIHPSLLPDYPGLDTHARVLAAGDLRHGASVHFVTPELDGGPVIAQSVVPVKPDDTADSLAARVLEREHELYVKALELCLNGNARLANGQPANTHSDSAQSAAQEKLNG